MRGATVRLMVEVVDDRISIHAPLCGERPGLGLFPRAYVYFNPRSPMRGATQTAMTAVPCSYFNPRSPMRGATLFRISGLMSSTFQSTLPYAGSDTPPSDR